MKRIILFFAVLFALSISNNVAYAQEAEYKKWDDHDVKGLYKEVSKKEASENWNSISFGDGSDTRYFIPVKQKSGVYEIEVYEKVDSKFWSIHYSSLFILFRYNPYLYKFDEGILEWDGYSGTFYEEP